MKTLDEAIQQIWKPADSTTTEDGNHSAKLRELVRYASLAASSHNTQPWKFHLEETGITVVPDLSRATPVVDPDNHHLYVSLGCAVENLVIAANAHGLHATVDTSNPESGIYIDLVPCKAESSELFEAIPHRQCTRNLYDGRPIDPNELALLKEAGMGKEVRALIVTDPERTKRIANYVVEANTAQFSDKNFTNEIKKWVRFGVSEAVTRGDGLHGRAMGNNAPSTPRWLGSLIFNFVVGPDNEKFRQQIESSSGLALFVSDKDDPEHWVEVGRCYERFALQATALGVKNAMVNQPVEVGEIRPRFQQALGLDCTRADLVVRFGYGEDTPKTLRRSVDEIVIE